MVIHNVEINVDFDKWKSDIVKEVEEYQEYYKHKSTSEWKQVAIALLASAVCMICMTIFCADPDTHTFCYHLLGAVLIAFVICVGLYFINGNPTFERNILIGMYGSELDELIKYVKDESESLSRKSAFEFLNDAPGIEDIIRNWKHISVLQTKDISVHADPNASLEITLYDKNTKERTSLRVDHIYADHNEPEDGKEKYILLINEESSILYEEGIFDNETKVTMLNQAV